MAEATNDPGSEEQEELLVEEAAGLTTQRSAEDEEEAARERRRRERDRQLQAEDEDLDHQALGPEQDKLLHRKTSETPELDEDEGFSDWSQKPGPRGQLAADGREATLGDSPQEQEHEENRQVM